MSAAIMTASAWVNEPKWVYQGRIVDDPYWSFHWSLLAEVSVSDETGLPVDALRARSLWKAHVTDASGLTINPPFTVSNVALGPQRAQIIPGFYRLQFSDVPTGFLIALASLGIVLSAKTVDLHGQVVVPIEFKGLTAVWRMTSPRQPGA